ncbi:MAG: MATE family efflux transporter [Oscillospiraceae bacterium]
MDPSKQRNYMMLEAPVNKVIPRLAIPTIISMLTTSIYSMADTYFVSQIGTSASGAVGVIFSAMAMLQAIAFMLGIGSGNNIAQLLGAGNEDEARRYASVGFFTAFFIGLLIMLIGNLNLAGVVRFLGATETILPYAVAYARYIFFAAPFIMCSFVMNNLLRFSGLAAYAMVGITTGGILNIILDPIFIFVFGLGTAGAALATAFSQLVSFTILLIMCNSRPDAISIDPRRFKPTLKIYYRMLYIGFPSLARQGIASISTVILNKMAGPYGDTAIAALSIVARFGMFLYASVIGFGQGFQPVCGFSYGAHKYSRVKEAFWFCVKVSMIVLLVLAAVSALFSTGIIALFRRDDPEVIRIGTIALRLQLMVVPALGWTIMSNMLTQSIGYGVRATIMSMARQGLFLIPLLLILPHFLGLYGILTAQPISDVLSMLLSIFIMRGVLRNLDNTENNQAPGT